MLDIILKFINANPIASVIIVLLLIYVVSKLYRKNQENFTDVEKNNYLTTRDELSSLKFKLMNFKCNINGEDYYLTVESEKRQNECKFFNLILVNANQSDADVKTYVSNLEIDSKKCAALKTIDCDAKNSDLPASCSDPEYCSRKRFHPRDFILRTSSTEDRYLLYGVTEPVTDMNKLSQYQYLMNSNNGKLCFDKTKFDDLKVPEVWVEVVEQNSITSEEHFTSGEEQTFIKPEEGYTYVSQESHNPVEQESHPKKLVKLKVDGLTLSRSPTKVLLNGNAIYRVELINELTMPSPNALVFETVLLNEN
jgi:hypothetical protein